MTQRWSGGRESYRPAGEPINTSSYGVEPIEGKGSDTIAKSFVRQHHYSGSYPAACHRVGLYRGRELVGVCVFSVPSQRAAVSKWCGIENGLVLGRFVLLDDVPANGETWFLAKAFASLAAAKPAIDAVLSYADPVPRLSTAGVTVMPGHVGTIYQAFNGAYHGRSKRETQWFGPDGRLMDRRSFSKIRNGETGAAPAYDRFRALGAPQKRSTETWAQYILRAKAEGPFRRVRHPGNHVYTWPLIPPFTDFGKKRRRRKQQQFRREMAGKMPLPSGLPFPKQSDITT